MKPFALLLPTAMLVLLGCTPSDTFKPAAERHYESADSAARDSTAAPSDSTSNSEVDDDDKTEEVILRSL